MVLLFLMAYVGSAFSPGLQDDADSTHAEAAREMYTTGDYVTLHVNGIRYLEKAPLMYWLVAASYHVFGVNEFATHLPTLLAILGLMLLSMKWAREAFGERAGFYAGVFVCSTVGYFLFTRILIPEAILSLFIALALYWFLTGLENADEAWRIYGAYACMALAVLTKGLFALVAIVGPMFFYLLLSGEWRRWRGLRLGTGTLLFVAIAAPWHILAGMRNPHFFWFYFVNEHFLRFLGKRYPVDYNKLPASLYWLLHLVWLFPWSLYLPIAVRRGWRLFQQRRERPFGFGERTELLCWLWAGVILVFFSLSTNQEYYTFPVYLPVLLLLANAVARAEESREGKWLAGSACGAGGAERDGGGSAGGRSLEFTQAAVRVGHWKRIGAAGPFVGDALDGPHAGFDWSVVCGATIAGGAGDDRAGTRAFDGAGVSFATQTVGGNADYRDDVRGVLRGSSHRIGALRSLPGVAQPCSSDSAAIEGG